MKLNSAILLFILFVFPASLLLAQNKPENYYLFPVRTGEVNYLAGNMGELRSNHFHSGIDIKTGGVEGLPVAAAAEGYISRIKVSAWGYGNALYIQHPNGETTVYGHLQRFRDDIQQYVRAAQYKEKTFEIEVFPEKDIFPVKRGALIAYSGNTGGSGGPHLHFEIRDRNQEVLNPLKYGFEEIKDNVPPRIEKIALITLEKDARVNDLFGRFEFDVVRSGNDYYLKSPVAIHGKVGLEVLGYDQANGASNRNGIACFETFVDNDQIFNANIAKFSFSETRDVLVFHNYAAYQKTGQRFYKLYIDDGNNLPFYKESKSNGILEVKDSSTHTVSINFYDSYENKSNVTFKVYNRLPPAHAQTKAVQTKSENFSEVFENVLKISSSILKGKSNTASVYANRLVYDQQPAYTVSDRAIYLWDLKQGLPDSILIGNDTWKFNFEAMVPSTSTFSLYTSFANIYFPKRALFDTLFVQASYWQDDKNEIFGISQDLYPLQRNITITLKPRLDYLNKERTQVYSVSATGRYNFEGGEWQNGHIKFNTRNFGNYTLLTDSVAPEIKPVKLNKQEVSFVITDDLSGIFSYEAFINNEWLLMNYDYKRSLIWSEKLTPDVPLEGDFMLKVKDQAGNESIYTTKL